METQLPLKNIAVLVTRPRPFAEELQTYLDSMGAKTIVLPIFEIQPSSQQVRLAGIVDALDEFDMAIFISRNAVRYTWPLIHARWSQLPTIIWAAIGHGTAQDLISMGAQSVLYPPKTPYNSEHFLSLPPLQDIQGKKVLIFRGDQGRTLLAETLTARGASVTLVETYVRNLTQISSENIQNLYSDWDEQKIDVIVSTSNDGLEQLAQLTCFIDKKNFTEIPVILVSERMLVKAHDLGFKTCILAESASNSAILHALITWKKTVFNKPYVP
ncbi:MAG: uroporphyrinogen-III synthase [Gammaproteobacteria bacterium]